MVEESGAPLDGESLHDRFERDRVPFDDSLDILDQIARGLDVVHVAVPDSSSEESHDSQLGLCTVHTGRV